MWLRVSLARGREAKMTDKSQGAERTVHGIVIVDAPSAVQDIRDATLVKEGDLFLLADLEGNVPMGNTNGFGLYHRDTRFLSALDLAVQGLRPTILLSSGRWPFLGTYVLTNPHLVTDQGASVPKETIQIRRYRKAHARRLSESFAFQSFNAFALLLDAAISVDADFADIFEVRGFTKTEAATRLIVREVAEASLTFRYEGRDGLRRTTRVRFDPPPTSLAGGVARYRLELVPRESPRITIGIEVEEEAALPAMSPGPTASKSNATPATGQRGWLDAATTIHCSNDIFNVIVKQARIDLRTLSSGDDDSAFLAAGIPWYAALFGRDSLIAALADVWISPLQAEHTLKLLADAQARRDDPWRDEEPGKILHELRRGELAGGEFVPFGPYFGTVDATPLWIMLAAEHYRATGNLGVVRDLLPHIEAALGWIDHFGDLDGDGFVEYRCRSPLGLANQGWKDSWDAVVHPDGTLAEPPIALVEVQAYVYAAKCGAARLFRALGDGARAAALEVEASRLRAAFDAAFWMPAEGFYCLALDGNKRQVASITSNPGHALFCGIVPNERAAVVADRLMAEDLFSGWGVRTLSNREVRYNPVGYHVGTVWPHDNALIALGLKRYGFETHALDIATGLFDAAQHFPSSRMPELFCGFARSAFGVPVRYPVACSPQAWAATSWSMLLQAVLGISADATAAELCIVRPALPSWLQWVELGHVPVGAGEVDLRYERIGERTTVDVVAMRGHVRVAFADRWPE